MIHHRRIRQKLIVKRFHTHDLPLPPRYNYIITGAGCAGSSLLMRMLLDPFFRDKQVLVIDAAAKDTNDRTWCFWEKEPDIFEDIVHHRWEQLEFFSSYCSTIEEISPYQYKMIRAADLYAKVQTAVRSHPNIFWKREQVLLVSTEKNCARVQTNAGIYTADYVFNSILFDEITKPFSAGVYHLLQHFKGWMIETTASCFDPAKACFMDFRISQSAGTSFMYVLPVSATVALVEYTLFTEELLPQKEYAHALQSYIRDTLGISDYLVQQEEFGVIPMTNHLFPLQEGRVVHIGIAGGQAKGSSGYAFRFIQKRTREIITQLKTGKALHLQTKWADRKFHLYDSVLLHVLQQRKMPGDTIFTAIFQKNPMVRVLRFLDNESSIPEDMQIMRSVPSRIFLPAALKELVS